MKRILLSIVFMATVLWSVETVNGITLVIEDVYTDPNQPTNIEVITIVVSGLGYSGPIWIDDSVFQMEGTSLELDIFITLGPYAWVTPWSYSEGIGMLPADFYDLTVRAYSYSQLTKTYELSDTYLTSFTVVPYHPKTYYVNAAEGSDNNDGLSPETAFATIQKAIDTSYNGDTVLVADGTYTGPGNRDIDFLGKAITVRSESGPKNCIIDCNANRFDRHHGFNFRSGEGPNSVVDGLTITNGYGKIVLVGCHLFASGGGGIFCYDSSPKIRNCVINNNSAVFGGGICCSCGSNATITNCTISGNSAEFGGGISCYDSNATITYCEVNNNYASGVSVGFGVVGDGGPAKGGGIYCIGRGNATTVRNCIVAGNKAVAGNGGWHGWHPGDGGNGYGGGICCDFKSEPKIENCTIVRNTVSGGNGGWILAIPPYRGGDGGNGYGGGISCSYQSKVTIRNCTVTDNATSGGRGAVDGQGYGAGICCESDGTGTMSNCILWSNSLEQIYGSETATYSNVQGGWPGEGNIDADPCFVEPGYWADANDPNIIVEPNDPNAVWIDGDYYLLPDSLCIDAGDPCYIPEPDETDLDGNPRVINGRIDMGAYETNYIQAAMKFTPQTLNCNSKGKYVKAHLTLPEGFLAQDVDVNKPAVAEPIDIESEYIKVLGSHKGQVKLEICFDRQAFCETITETGEVEITVIGSLTTSRYFYATDTIKIKPRR